MAKSSPKALRREGSLSRDRIVEVAIDLLDRLGEEGLTFRALAERLATGPGALYWHVASRAELLIAACDSVVGRTLDGRAASRTPAATIRALALALFDAFDAHPWIGIVLTQAPGKSPMVRILERFGQPLQLLGVPPARQWPTVFALTSYVLGGAGQNAANAQLASRMEGSDRASVLDALASEWSQLDPLAYPFTRSIAARFRVHDDRADFLAGVDLILRGIETAYADSPIRGKALPSQSSSK